jgi:hypothetical protein
MAGWLARRSGDRLACERGVGVFGGLRGEVSVADAVSGIDDVLGWLGESGFVVVSDRTYESFGNRTVILVKEPVAIRLEKDRGIWMIGISGPFGEVPSESAGIWFEPKIWRSYLDRTRPSTAPEPWDAQVSFVKTRLPDVRAAQLDEDVTESLRKLRKSEAQARFGHFD